MQLIVINMNETWKKNECMYIFMRQLLPRNKCEQSPIKAFVIIFQAAKLNVLHVWNRQLVLNFGCNGWITYWICLCMGSFSLKTALEMSLLHLLIVTLVSQTANKEIL